MYYFKQLQKFPLSQKHTIKTTVFLYLFPGVLVMITVVIIKEALCFCESEPLFSDDNSITENEDMNINNINGSYVSNI